ncbi:hypothetical protein B0H14DRAFT_2556893 [Mycena olivaceomarginata]|nr:hypothetical protein B0H14DRAFT_2556893 [Mycena olivaceomarginata]
MSAASKKRLLSPRLFLRVMCKVSAPSGWKQGQGPTVVSDNIWETDGCGRVEQISMSAADSKSLQKSGAVGTRRDGNIISTRPRRNVVDNISQIIFIDVKTGIGIADSKEVDAEGHVHSNGSS